MIRKDVKFGLTIGGILVIVLVVYLSVITRGPDKPKSQDVTLAQNPTDGQQPAQAAPDAAAPVAPTASQPPLTNPQNGTAGLPIVPAATDTGTAAAPATPAPAARTPDASPTHADGNGEVATTVTPSITTPVPTADGSTANATNTNAPTPDALASPVASARKASWETALSNGPTALFAPADPDRSSSATADPAAVNGADPQPAAAQQYPSPDNPPTRRTSGGGGSTGDATPTPAHAKPSAPAVADGLPTTRPTVATQHKIAAGETFVSLARTVYGDRKFYLKILAANPTIDPKHLKPGMTITLPAYEASASTPAAADPAPAAGSSAPKNTAAPKDSADDKAAPKKAVDTAHEYEVQAGDTLERITRKLYHNQKWHRIYELNKEAIGDDPADLKVGMVLKLPEAPLAEASR